MAYLYILLESLYIGIKEKNFFKINLLKTDIILLIKQYIKCTCIVTILDFLLRLVLPKIYLSNPELIAMINMIAVMTSYHIKFLDKVFTICLLIAATVVCFLISGGISFNNRIEVYAIVFIVLLFRLCAEKYNYKVIPTAKVEKGMVIAYPTVLYFISSKINGLPKKTTEDMRSRITEDEARSIQRWENSKYGQPTIVIVRKIPFAIFISIGSIIYVIIRILSEI